MSDHTSKVRLLRNPNQQQKNMLVSSFISLFTYRGFLYHPDCALVCIFPFQVLRIIFFFALELYVTFLHCLFRGHFHIGLLLSLSFDWKLEIFFAIILWFQNNFPVTFSRYSWSRKYKIQQRGKLYTMFIRIW